MSSHKTKEWSRELLDRVRSLEAELAEVKVDRDRLREVVRLRQAHREDAMRALGRWIRAFGHLHGAVAPHLIVNPDDPEAMAREAVEEFKRIFFPSPPPSPPTREDAGRDPEDSSRIADRYCNKCGRIYRGPGQHDGCTYYAGIVHHHNAPASSEGERHG